MLTWQCGDLALHATFADVFGLEIIWLCPQDWLSQPEHADVYKLLPLSEDLNEV